MTTNDAASGEVPESAGEPADQDDTAALDDAAELRERIARLEADNEALAVGRTERPGRTRTIVSATLIVVGLVLAPVAVLGSWVRAELVDTDRFVQTLAPLAAEESVQDFITDRTTTVIDENLNLTGVVGDMFAGIAGLDLPPTAQVAVAQLEAPAVAGVESLISSGVQRVVGSEQFVQIWESVLRETHTRSIAVIQGQPGTAVTLADDGTVALDVGVVVSAVRDALIANGVTIAESIPAISSSVPLLQNDSLAGIRTGYQLAVGVGTWLPWVAFGALVLGVALARRRIVVASRAGAWLAVSLGVLAAALAIGRMLFIGAVSPAVMPATTADVIFEQLTSLLVPTVVALIVFGVLVAVGAWIAGPSRAAGAIRGAVDAVFDSIRRFLDAHGLGTARFGRTLDRIRPALITGVVVLAVLIVFLVRPVTTGSVLWTVFWMLVALLLVEVLRRPERAVVDEEEVGVLEKADAAAIAAAAPDADSELITVPVGLSESDLAFLDSPSLAARYGSRTAAVQDAVRLLRERRLGDRVD